MRPEELKENGQRLFRAGQYTDAIPLLKSAVEAFPKDECLWMELVLAARDSEQQEQAIEFAKQGIRQLPRSDWMWRQLGYEMLKTDLLDEAERALNNAHSLNPDSDWLWRYLAELHRKQKNLEKEIEALQNLHALGEAKWTDLNELGIAYYNHKNFAKALEYYRLSAETEPIVYPLFNMGLVFNDPEVSQDADAADAYRRALVLRPDYGPAKERLDDTRGKLVPLAEHALAATTGLIQSDDLFRFYVSPFEALQIDEIGLVEELDVKVIQRAKKKLLQEIELNDGKVSWLENYSLDKTRALIMEDELFNEKKRRYHWAVFQNKRLLGFLTRGDIRHFIYSDDYFPLDTLELLDQEPEFRTFLSKPFSRQYNLVLNRAIERRLLPVVEVLFDGRRWVETEDEDICFEGALKRIGELVELMRSKAAEGCTRKVSLQEIEDFLRQHSFPELFNLLPTNFASAQRDVVAEIRSLAISCFNEHNDSDLSKGILRFCKRFTSRSVELTKRLEADFQTIERMIAEERKYESRLTFGPERPFEITKEGIRDGARFFPANSIRDVRWGIRVTGYTGSEKYEYLLAVGNDSGETITASWATDKSGKEKQTEYFSDMVNAAMNYLCATVVEKLHKRLASGQQVVIGPCTLTRQGIAFRSQGLITKHRFFGWRDVKTETRNGQMVVTSRAESRIAISISMRDTENAVLLPILSGMMEEEYDPTERGVPELRCKQESSDKSSVVGWLVFIAATIATIVLVIVIGQYSNQKQTRPRGDSHAPLSGSSASNSTYKTAYRVPSHIDAELDKDNQAIENEKAKAEEMARRLKSLSAEIKRAQMFVGPRSTAEVNEYNLKVGTYNGLLKEVREQERLVNQMVTSYNDKLRKYGR